MRVVTRYIIQFLVVCLFCANAYSDGRMYIPDRVPADIPYQRAFLIHHEGFETLILQSKYEFSQSADVNSIGWVVPVPAVPELASVDADRANWFFLRSSMTTGPSLIYIRSIFFFLCLFLVVYPRILVFVTLALYPFLAKIGISRNAWDRLHGISSKGLWIGLCLILIYFFMGLFQTAGVKSTVEVVSAKQVGIYNVGVIKSDSTEAIVNWLKENKFNFNDTDTEVFADYVNKKWCFVTAKVRSDVEAEKGKMISVGMVAPFILKFESEKAVYPLALTSVNGTETEVLLYTLSENKLNCNERMKLRYAAKTKTKYLPLQTLYNVEPDIEALIGNLPEEMTICKFKGKLTSEQMKQDLEFEDAKENEPFREKKIVW